MFKWLKNIAVLGTVAYALNIGALPVAGTISNSVGLHNQTIQQVMETRKYRNEYTGTNEERAQQYLQLAHAITAANTDYQRTEAAKRMFSDDSKLVDGGVVTCKETTRFTYSNYLFLIDQANEPELRHYVRSAYGKVEAGENGLNAPHVWLEVKKDNEWTPYETTQDGKEEVLLNPEVLESQLVFKASLRSPEEYTRLGTVQEMDDGRLAHAPDWMNILTDYEGVAVPIYHSIKKTWDTNNMSEKVEEKWEEISDSLQSVHS